MLGPEPSNSSFVDHEALPERAILICALEELAGLSSTLLGTPIRRREREQRSKCEFF